MAVYQDKAHTRILKSLRRLPGIVEKAKAEGYKEADTRTIVNEVLSDTLGWDKYDDITAEQMIAYGYADYVVKKDVEPLMVIEVKQIGIKLRDTHLTQARHYAVDEGIDWVVLTNGDEWQVHRMNFDAKPPYTEHVFTLSITDKTISNKEKTQLFYLLSKEAYRRNEIEDFYKRKVAISATSLADHIICSNKNRVITSYEKSSIVALDSCLQIQRLHSLLQPNSSLVKSLQMSSKELLNECSEKKKPNNKPSKNNKMRSAKACIEELDRGKRYRVSIELSRDPKTGKRRRKYKTIRGSRVEAERAKNRLLAIYDYDAPASCLSLEEYTLQYFLPACKSDCKTRTYESYRNRLERHILPVFGSVELAELSAPAIRRWLATMKPTVARECRKMLYTVCQQAVYDGQLLANPIAQIKPPKVAKYSPEVLDADQIAIYLEHFRDTRIEPVVLLALGCGLRRGEICALNVEDIDFETGAVVVDDTYVVANGSNIIHDTPKSESGYRTVHMPESLLHRLKEIIPPKGAIMRALDGSRMSPGAISRLYARTRENLPEGIPKISLKNLRHTSLTLAYDSGVDLLAVSRRAGHSNTRITADYYVRPKGQRDRQAAAAMDTMLEKGKL